MSTSTYAQIYVYGVGQSRVNHKTSSVLSFYFLILSFLREDKNNFKSSMCSRTKTGYYIRNQNQQDKWSRHRCTLQYLSYRGQFYECHHWKHINACRCWIMQLAIRIYLVVNSEWDYTPIAAEDGTWITAVCCHNVFISQNHHHCRRPWVDKPILVAAALEPHTPTLTHIHCQLLCSWETPLEHLCPCLFKKTFNIRLS